LVLETLLGYYFVKRGFWSIWLVPNRFPGWLTPKSADEGLALNGLLDWLHSKITDEGLALNGLLDWWRSKITDEGFN